MMIPGIMAQRRVVSGGGTLWTPLDMATAPPIYLHMQDSTVTDVSGFASAISNLGSLGSDGDFVQVTSGNRPEILAAHLNGKRVLRFDSDSMYCNSTAARNLLRNKPAAFSFIVYLKRTADVSNVTRTLIYVSADNALARFTCQAGYPSTGGRNRPVISGKRLDADSVVQLIPASTAFGQNMTSFAIDYTSGNAEIVLNGSSFASGSLTTSGAATSDTISLRPIGLGSIVSETFTQSGAGDVDIAAVVLCDFEPSSDDQLRLQGWAAHEWGGTASLPGGHPYKTTPPYA